MLVGNSIYGCHQGLTGPVWTLNPMTSVFMRGRDLDMGMAHRGEFVKINADWNDAIVIKGMPLLVMTRR